MSGPKNFKKKIQPPPTAHPRFRRKFGSVQIPPYSRTEGMPPSDYNLKGKMDSPSKDYNLKGKMDGPSKDYNLKGKMDGPKLAGP